MMNRLPKLPFSSTSLKHSSSRIKAKSCFTIQLSYTETSHSTPKISFKKNVLSWSIFHLRNMLFTLGDDDTSGDFEPFWKIGQGEEEVA